MARTVFPVDAVTGAPLYSGRKLRQALAVLASGATPARPLGGLSGLRPGQGAVVTATATVWTVKPHSGQMDLQTAAEASVYLYANDANVTGAVTASDANNPRVDIIFATLADPAESDGTAAPDVTFGYLAGVAAASPVAPATPARSFVIATIAVPKTGGGSPSVTLQCLEVGSAGTPVGVRSKTQRDALTAFAGMEVRRLDDGGRLERWNGTRWVGTTTTSYTSIGDGSAPATAIGNNNGTVLETLTIPAVEYDRTLDVSMNAFIATSSSADSWEVVGTYDSLNIATNVLGRSRVAQTSSGSGTFRGFVDQPAGTTRVLRVWVRRISGTGTGTGTNDETYTNINVVARPS